MGLESSPVTKRLERREGGCVRRCRVFHCLNDDAAVDFFFQKMNEITFDVIIFCRAKQVATKRRCGYGLSCSGICISWAGSCTDTPEKFSSSDCSSCPPSASDSNPPPSRRTSRNCGSKVSRHFYFIFPIKSHRGDLKYLLSDRIGWAVCRTESADAVTGHVIGTDSVDWSRR